MRVAEQRDGVHITLNKTFAAANTRGVASPIRVMYSGCHTATKRYSKEWRFALQTWTTASTKADATCLLKQLTAAQTLVSRPNKPLLSERFHQTCMAFFLVWVDALSRSSAIKPLNIPLYFCISWCHMSGEHWHFGRGAYWRWKQRYTQTHIKWSLVFF
jgi:hypothetical protein